MLVPKWSRVSAVLFAAGVLAILLAAVPDGVHAQTPTGTECYPSPEIYTQPQDQTITQGSSATLSVSANAFTVKWYRGAVGNKTTQVASTESFSTGALAETTQYWAEVSNFCGTLQSRQVTVTVVPAQPQGPCVTDATTACLLNTRFRVKIDYNNIFATPPVPGTLKAAKLVAGDQNPDTATFGFETPQAIEVVVRIQDTSPFGFTRFDVYYGGMTDIEYTVTVQDTQTNTTRQYKNPGGMVGGGVDRTSFPTDGSSTPAFAIIQGNSQPRTPIVAANSPIAACAPDNNKVCLLDGRFEVRIDYVNPFSNPPNQPGTFLGTKFSPGSQNPDTATFGFGSALAIEAVVRLQDVSPFGINNVSVYYGGMTDVEFTVTVTDKTTGRTRQYKNPVGQVGGSVDRTSFPAN